MDEKKPVPLPVPVPKPTPKPQPKSLPVFIKIDKYEEITKALQNLKSKTLTLRDTLDALDDMEKELRTAISLAHKALNYFNEALSALDAKLLRLEGIEPEEKKKDETQEYLKSIHEQIEKIRNELRTISSEY